MTQYRPKDVDHSVNVSSENELKDFTILIVATIALVFFVGSLIYGFAEQIAHKISFKQEQEIAAKLSLGDGIFSKLKEKEDRYLEKLTNELWQPFNSEGVSLEAKTIAFKQENAFIYLGGHIRVTETLLNNAESENDLAFVLCHEIGHFYNRHVLKAQGGGLILLALSSLMSLSGSDISSLVEIQNAAQLNFSREQETQADEFAVDCMAKKYGHIAHYDRFFLRVKKSLDPSDSSDSISSFMSTHPLEEDRIHHISEIAHKANIPLTGELIPSYYSTSHKKN